MPKCKKIDPFGPKTLHEMIRYRPASQLSLEGFSPWGDLDPENRWVKLGNTLPWDDLAAAYHVALSADKGRPAVDARRVIGALLIKHKQKLDDRETIDTIKENPYMQWFCGLTAFTTEPLFDPSLFVTLRKRMGGEGFARMNEALVAEAESRSHSGAREKKAVGARPGKDDAGDGSGTLIGGGGEGTPTDPAGQGKAGELKIDATVAPQGIAYPTDLGLLNTCREISEGLIDGLHACLDLPVKPRTYRRKARQAYLSVVRKKKRTRKEVRQAIGKQLRFLRRNLRTIHRLLDQCGENWPLGRRSQRLFWVVQQVHDQQWHDLSRPGGMFREGVHTVADRIVSVHQPHVRPIVRGKASANTEFGSKIAVGMSGGYAWLDVLRWDAYNENQYLIAQVERYKQRHGHHPQAVNADGIYGTRENRAWLKEHGIRFIGKAVGRPSQESLSPKAKRDLHKDMARRNRIEGKFGEGKTAYGLDRVLARLQRTSEAWVSAIFMVMNLAMIERKLLVLPQNGLAELLRSFLQALFHRLDRPMGSAMVPSFAHVLHPSRCRVMPTNIIGSGW